MKDILRHAASLCHLALVLLVLSSCGVGGSASDESALQRLPTVTMMHSTSVPTATPPLPTLVPIATGTPAPPTPSDPALVISPDGPVTGSMARMNLTGERYAALGDPKAAVTLVEFADYGCPYCHEYQLSVFPQLKERYIDTGKLYYVYKHFPISSRQGGSAAEAAECAGEGGHFWEMHSILFNSAQEWEGEAAQAQVRFQSYAKEIGLNEQAFVDCLKQGRTAAVKQDFDEGTALNVNGTPTFFINGKRVIGAQSFDDFAELIERELTSR